MVTKSYTFTNVGAETSQRYTGTGTDLSNPDVAALNGKFAYVYEFNNGGTFSTLIEQRLNSNAASGPAYLVLDNSSNGAKQSDPSIAALAGGGLVAVWSETTGLHASLISSSFVQTTTDLLLPGTDTNDSFSDVAGLKNGGFVVAKQDTVAGDIDADLLFYTNTGVLTRSVSLGNNSTSDERRPAVAVLANGTVAVAFEKERSDGSGTFSMALEIYSSDGSTRLLAPLIFDSSGTQLTQPSIVALKDGGFAVAYLSDVGTASVKVAFLNAAGGLRSTVTADFDSAADGTIGLSVLDNGYVAVSMTDQLFNTDQQIPVTIIDPVTFTKPVNYTYVENQTGNQNLSSIAGLSDGTFVTAWTDANTAVTDGNTWTAGTHISTSVDALVRTTTGTAANETFRGDAIFDNFIGGGGDDTFVYAVGGHKDSIAGFTPGNASGDKIILSGFSAVHSFNDLVFIQNGGDTEINFGNGDFLTLKSVSAVQLNAGDFDFKVFQDEPSLVVASFGAGASGGGWSNNQTYHRVVGDITGDHRADIVGFGSAGVYVSVANPDGTYSPNPVFALASFGSSDAGGGWSTDDKFHREVADVNGDGRQDIVGFGGAGVYVSLASGGGAFANPTLMSNTFGTSPSAGGFSSQNLYTRLMADVDGDGKADIVGFGSAGTYVALSTGTGFGAAVLKTAAFGSSDAAGGWSNDDRFHREMADVNGDGKADIVGFGVAGTYVALATGNGNFGNAFLAISNFGTSDAAGGWSSETSFTRHLGDVNGDGRADIVGFGGNSTFVALGRADGTFGDATADVASFGFNPSAGSWTSDQVYPRLLGDIDGGGSADIFGFGANGVYLAHSNVDWII